MRALLGSMLPAIMDQACQSFASQFLCMCGSIVEEGAGVSPLM